MPTPIAPNPFIIQLPPDFVANHLALKHAGTRLAQQYAANYLVTEEQLQQVGGLLWQALDADAALAAALQQAGNATLPIIIESDEAAAHQLPWETLYHPEHGFLGRANGFTLLRRAPGLPVPAAPADKGPLRVLLFTALPDDVDAEKERLNIEAEQAQILDALSPLLGQGQALLEMPDDGRFPTLCHMLQTFRPHLVFLSGHGRFLDDPLSDNPPTSTFLFENEQGDGVPVAEGEIAQAFRGHGVECVALISCELGKTASTALTLGLAWRLSQNGIPHVIGMRESLLDRAGTLFSRAFCDAIARGDRVDTAVQAGRAAMITPLQDSPLMAADSGLAEKSFGQWSLPMLLSPAPDRLLLDKEAGGFAAAPVSASATHESLDTVTLPPQFIGRRTELRALKSRLRAGQLRQLLITGPGGQGKTALAGELALDLARRGYTVAAYAVRPENIWRKFFLSLLQQLTPANRGDYASMEPFLESEEEKAAHLLKLLLRQYDGKVLLLLDNLETAQAPDYPHALTDERLAAWIAAAQGLAAQGLLLLLTSRWRLPDWADADHWPLHRASYGDFLRMGLALVEQKKLSPAWLSRRKRMRQVYDTLHGNGRGLTFFAGAVQGMSGDEEADFLARLAQAQGKTQSDMSLAQITAHLAADARQLLHRLPAYQTPVPIEGIVKLGLDMDTRPETALAQLLAVSLVEPTTNHRWQVQEYQLPPLVADWLRPAAGATVTARWWQEAAAYQQYLFENERDTLAQAIAVHQARRAAGDTDGAHHWALDYIVGPLERDGLYETLLTEWLPDMCAAPDLRIQAAALNQSGKQHLHLGNYAQALPFFERSLKIWQEIDDKSRDDKSRDDKSGEGATLNNISQIFKARGDYDTALHFLQRLHHLAGNRRQIRRRGNPQ
ncbi:MAG: CHAT domain-containing protein [Chloroflexota bacterium]